MPTAYQGRFQAHLVEADEYAQQLIKTIHLNPVRPKDKRKPIPIARKGELDAYPWSSHRAYAGRLKRLAPPSSGATLAVPGLAQLLWPHPSRGLRRISWANPPDVGPSGYLALERTAPGRVRAGRSGVVGEDA